jgi:pimeloyl-ACP methyl ester carboxylesterase
LNQLWLKPVRFVASFSLLLTFGISSAALANDCGNLLKAVPGSYQHYVDQSEEARGSSKAKHPEFLNPETERRLAQMWKGELGPEALQQMLPPGVTFVGHQLRKSSAPGVVKVESGDLLILRVEMPFKGQTISTNVTVNAQALFKNLERSFKGEKLWLIGPEAKAALDWGHGGGTKTTGGHTADTLMNYMSKYDVFTIGMDQPWHGEGPRVWFKDDEEYFQFRIAFRERFIAPSVPTFLVGHSKGGLVADMALRRTGKGFEELGLDKAYAGVIPLSFVPDVKPGGSFTEKTQKERQKDIAQKEEKIMERMNPGDLNLFANLMAEDKTSALSGLFCSFLSIFNDWKTNFHPTIPSLYVMGEHDALYILSEENIEKYVRDLDHATLWTFSSRVSFRGEVEAVGHMIFDHYVPKKNHPEAVNVMTAYLSKVLADQALPQDEASLQKLFKEKVLKDHVNEFTYLTPVNNYSSTLVLMAYQWVPGFKEFLESRIQGQDHAKYFLGYTEEGVFETYKIIKDFVAKVLADKGIEMPEISVNDRIAQAREAADPLANNRESILNFLKAYGNNLAFREFLKSYTYRDMGATPEFGELNKLAGVLTQRMKVLGNIRKEKISDEEKQKKIEELGPLHDEFGKEIAAGDLTGYQKAVERISLIRNKALIPEGPLHDFAQANVSERNGLYEQIRTLEKERDQMKKNLEDKKKEMNRLEGQFDRVAGESTSAVLQDYEKRRQDLFKELEAFDFRLRDVQEVYLAEVLEKGRNLVEAFDHLPAELLALYQETEATSQKYQALLQEGKALKKSEALAGTLGQEAKDVAQALYGPQGLEAEVNTRTHELAVMEYQTIGQLKEAQEALLSEYVAKVMPQFFKISQFTLDKMLGHPLKNTDEVKEAYKFAEKALSQWRSRVLSSKPEGGDSSLY